jgi:hypothetical protein
VTYKGYLDFVLSRKDLDFCTIDTDYGCGVIRLNGADRSPSRPAERATAPEDRDRIVEQWMRLDDDYDAAFKLLMAHSGALLNLVTVKEFLAAERRSAPALV